MPVHGAGEGEDVGNEDVFEEGEFFSDAGEGLPFAEVFGIEGAPFVEAVAEGLLPGVEVVLLHMKFGNAHVVVLLADAQAPVGLGEEMLGFLYAVVEEEEHGAHLLFVGIYFILDKGISLMYAAAFVVVVVEPVVFQPDLLSHGASELREAPGFQGGVESDG